MKTKKILAVLLSAAMVCSLSACGSSSNSSDTTDGVSTQTTEATEATETTDETETEAETKTETEESSGSEIAFEETTFVDNEYLTATVKSITISADVGCVLNMEIKNNSADINYSVKVSATAEGVTVPTTFYGNSFVDAGEEITTDLYIDVSGLSASLLGLGYSDLEITLTPINDDTLDTMMEETFHIYPYGEEQAVVFERDPQDSDQVLIDNDYMTVTVLRTDLDDEEYYGITTYLYLQNKTDRFIDFTANNYTVDGFSVYGDILAQLSAGERGIEAIEIYQEELANDGIENPQTLELTIASETLDTFDDLFEETVTVNLQ